MLTCAERAFPQYFPHYSVIATTYSHIKIFHEASSTRFYITRKWTKRKMCFGNMVSGKKNFSAWKSISTIKRITANWQISSVLGVNNSWCSKFFVALGIVIQRSLETECDSQKEDRKSRKWTLVIFFHLSCSLPLAANLRFSPLTFVSRSFSSVRIQSGQRCARDPSLAQEDKAR